MDSNEFERERGITIASKYTSFAVSGRRRGGGPRPLPTLRRAQPVCGAALGWDGGRCCMLPVAAASCQLQLPAASHVAASLRAPTMQPPAVQRKLARLQPRARRCLPPGWRGLSCWLGCLVPWLPVRPPNPAACAVVAACSTRATSSTRWTPPATQTLAGRWNGGCARLAGAEITIGRQQRRSAGCRAAAWRGRCRRRRAAWPLPLTACGAAEGVTPFCQGPAGPCPMPSVAKHRPRPCFRGIPAAASPRPPMPPPTHRHTQTHTDTHTFHHQNPTRVHPAACWAWWMAPCCWWTRTRGR